MRFRAEAKARSKPAMCSPWVSFRPLIIGRAPTAPNVLQERSCAGLPPLRQAACGFGRFRAMLALAWLALRGCAKAWLHTLTMATSSARLHTRRAQNSTTSARHKLNLVALDPWAVRHATCHAARLQEPA